MKIGIMGGTFNPIHNGHIAIAKAAYEQYGLDEVWFMPNHVPAYKTNRTLISGKHRLQMVSLAIEQYPYFRESDFELKREGKTYTYETMQLLKKQYPATSFFFIMGADSLFYFDEWKHSERIVENARILAAPRDSKSVVSVEEKLHNLSVQYGEGIFSLISCDRILCSSSDIRKQLSFCRREYLTKEDKNAFAASICLDPKVFDYIIKEQLYRN